MLTKYKECLDETEINSTSDAYQMIELLRCHLLFQDGSDPDESGDESSYHYLAGLAHLELAITSMKLFHLKANK